jgi:hypothetical protein
MNLVLIMLMILLIIGTLPAWSYSKVWGLLSLQPARSGAHSPPYAHIARAYLASC